MPDYNVEYYSKPQSVESIQNLGGFSIIPVLLPSMELIPTEFENDRNPWVGLVSDLFFSGGRLPKVKDGIDKKNAALHLRACLTSFEPQHEHKTAACAWLMSLWYAEPIQSIK